MLIKLASLFGAFVAVGLLSRGLYLVFKRNQRSIVSVIIINFIAFLFLMILGSYLFEGIAIIEKYQRSFLLFIAPLFIWITVDLVRLSSSAEKHITILRYEISLLSILVVSSIVISITALVYYPTEQERAAQLLRKEVGNVMDGLTDPSSSLAQTLLLDESPNMEGRAGEVERFIREVVNIGIEFRNKYRSEIAITEAQSLLDPARLRGALHRVHTEKILNDTLQIIEKYKLEQEEVYKQAKISAKNLKLDEDVKGVFIYNFNKSLENSSKINTEVWDLEREIIIKSGEMALWLGENNDAWIFENSQYQFYSSDDLNFFNTAGAELQQLVNKQTKIVEESSKKLRKGLKILE